MEIDIHYLRLEQFTGLCFASILNAEGASYKASLAVSDH